jgi:hypothetical protein
LLDSVSVLAPETVDLTDGTVLPRFPQVAHVAGVGSADLFFHRNLGELDRDVTLASLDNSLRFGRATPVAKLLVLESPVSALLDDGAILA